MTTRHSNALLLCMLFSTASLSAQTMQQRLLSESTAQLVADAGAHGDARRGAIVFFQPFMSCRQCHDSDDPGEQLGPDLSRWEKPATDEQLVDAVLRPSKEIRKRFESMSVLTADGKAIVGLVVENGDQITLRDPARPSRLFHFDRDELEAAVENKSSLMPDSLVNQLSSRQQFLDLLRYLIEIRDGGPRTARNLQPSPHLYAARPLPAYEQNIDHAGMIADLGTKNFRSGKAIYQRLCVNCHGTHDQPGSLPTSPRFASGQFKNGSDPFTMYQTLTRGFGMMQPQAWMVPQQKYDVIHYVRQDYLKKHNPVQYFSVDPSWLATLPKGDARGPSPQDAQPWVTMDYGQTLINTYEIGDDGTNFAYKGIAMRLDAGPGGVTRGQHWMIFDHDTLRMAATWNGDQFIDYNGIAFNGKHAIHPRIGPGLQMENKTQPGWANPLSGSWDDTRLVGRDGRHYGPVDRAWGQYNGIYRYGNQTVISYRVGSTQVLEQPELLTESPSPVYARHFHFGPREDSLTLQVAQLASTANHLTTLGSGAVVFGPGGATPDANGGQATDAQPPPKGPSSSSETAKPNRSAKPGIPISPAKRPLLVAGLDAPISDFSWSHDNGSLRLTVPRGDKDLSVTLWFASTETANAAESVAEAVGNLRVITPDWQQLLAGGPSQLPDLVTTTASIGSDEGPLAVDVLTRPAANPWLARVRLTGFDFFADGDSVAICSWDGDVWKVTGIDSLEQPLQWKRIATGLFQPLGVRIVDHDIYVTCRDQIVILRDKNGDGETDFYDSFNNDHQVTDHFHEFAMGLQTDAAGNFYYAKSARHALTALVPHHGTLLRVSKDGQQTDIVANGFRAANGVCLNPDGSFIVTDQEGHWNPKNRINWVHEGGFYGNMFGYHNVTDSSDAAMESPLCWITNDFDRSPAELLWVPKDCWGPLGGSLLSLSYGYGKIFVVPHEKVDGQMQGGMCELPMPSLPTGLVRGRFHPTNGHLYTCGMFAWAGNQKQPGGFDRIRATGKPMHLPVGLKAKAGELKIQWTDPLSRAAAEDPENYVIRVWDLKRTANYGSKHYNERPWGVRTAKLSDDGKTVTLSIPEIIPTWGMEVRCFVETPEGRSVERRIHNTIHQLPGG